MLCEKCKKRTATVFYNENINGKARSYSLCGDCAAKLREKGDLRDITSMIGSFADPFSELSDHLFGGFFGMPSTLSVTPAKACTACGSRFADIQKDGKVGCPDCYTVFREELAGLLHSIHGTTRHTGHVPARHRAEQERREKLTELKRQLAHAVSDEEYEQAAALRDEIRLMEGNNEKEGA